MSLHLRIYFLAEKCNSFRRINNITKSRLFKFIENFTTKKWKLSDKKSGSFHFSAQDLDCGYLLEPPRRGSSNEYPHSMFSSRNKKINLYPSKPQFYCVYVGFKGGQNYIGVFSWCYDKRVCSTRTERVMFSSNFL